MYLQDYTHTYTHTYRNAFLPKSKMIIFLVSIVYLVQTYMWTHSHTQTTLSIALENANWVQTLISTKNVRGPGTGCWGENIGAQLHMRESGMYTEEVHPNPTPPGIHINATNTSREPQRGVWLVGLLFCACVFLPLWRRMNLACTPSVHGIMH